MKKNIAIIICVLLSLAGVSAQNATDSTHIAKGNKFHSAQHYLPQAGDFAIGVDVTPLVELLGNTFNGYGTNGTKNTLGALGGSVVNLDYAPKPDVSVMVKYFLKDNLALRANIGVKTNNLTQRAYVVSDVISVTDPFSDEKLIDCAKSYNTGGSAALGLEFRAGKNRIQGTFGGDLVFAYQTRQEEYNYANTLSLLNSKPTMSSLMPAFDASGYRTTNKNYGDMFYGGAMLNIGVEYFILPKVAIGSEVNVMIYYRMGSTSYETREGLNPYTNNLDKREIINTPGDRELVIGTGNFGSKLYLVLYF